MKRLSIRFRTAALIALALSSVPFSSARAGEDASCTFSGGEVHVTLENNGSDGTLSVAAGVITFDGSNCDSATVLNTDSILIEDTTENGSTGITLDLSGGPFADGGDEIPMTIDLGGGSIDSFLVLGTTGTDNWTFGLLKGNLQNDDAAEIEFEAFPDLAIALPVGGADRVCAHGGSGTGTPSLLRWTVNGGSGADRLCGGNGVDALTGADQGDTIRGFGSGDTLRGKAGPDEIFGNKSSDLLKGGTGGDALDGGPSFDTCKGGPGPDSKTNCEGG